MGTVKKSTATVAEELRVLGSFADSPEIANMLNLLTPDFWATIGTAVTNLVTVAALLGWIHPNIEGLTQAIIALVGAAEVVALNSVLIWKYLQNRQDLRTRAMEAKFRYMEAIAVGKVQLAIAAKSET